MVSIIRTGTLSQLRIGTKAVNFQYLWFEEEKCSGCVYLELWKLGLYINIWKRFKLEFGSYDAEPERW